GLSETEVRKIANWLNQSFYKPLVFMDRPSRIYYAMYDGSMELLHNGIENGYVQLEMKCDSPYSYKPVVTTPHYEYTSGISNTVTIKNTGDVEVQPIVTITKIGNGNVK